MPPVIRVTVWVAIVAALALLAWVAGGVVLHTFRTVCACQDFVGPR